MNLLVLMLSFMTINAQYVKQETQSHVTQIYPGLGYSQDSQTIVNCQCFNYTSIKIENQHSELQFSEAVSYEQITQVLDINVDFRYQKKSWFSKLSFGGAAKYFFSNVDTALSTTVYYYFKLKQDIRIIYNYTNSGLLNSIGQELYQNGTNKYFRNLCGDTLIDQYSEQGSLVVGLTMFFKDRQSKQLFQTSGYVSGGSGFFGFGNAWSVAASLKIKFDSLKISGQIKVSALQQGGDPMKLSTILSTSTSQCSMDNVAACNTTISTILNYANTDFPKQFPKDDQGMYQNLVQSGEYVKGQRLSDLGLLMGNSLLNDEIRLAKQSLQQQYARNEYYQNKTQFILDNYPSALNSQFQKLLQEIVDNSTFNLNIFKNGCEVSDYQGAFACWRFPQRCISLFQQTLTCLKPLNDSSINDTLSRIKFIYQNANDTVAAWFWPRGFSNYWTYTPNWFNYIPPENPQFPSPTSTTGYVNTILSFKLNRDTNAQSIEIDAYFNYQNNIDQGQYTRSKSYLIFNSDLNLFQYSGNQKTCNPKTTPTSCKDVTNVITQEINPFWFPLFQASS